MANTVVWHARYGIELDLTQPHLGHPDRPGLRDEVYQPGTAARFEPGVLQCPECRLYGDPDCPEWMYLRRGHSGLLHAVHHNRNIKDHGDGESDAHKALKERMATAAQNDGLQADVESRGPDGKRRTDVRVRGGVRDLACEAQLSYVTRTGAAKRSRKAEADGLTPLWATLNRNAAFIGVAPWATLQQMHWQQFLSKNDLPVIGGARYLEWERCTRGRVCPDEAKGRRCSGRHARLLARGIRSLDHLIVGAARGEWVPCREPGSRVENWFWLTAEDHAQLGAPLDTSSQPALGPGSESDPADDDDTRELDRSCQYGQEREYTPVVPRRLDKPIVVAGPAAPPDAVVPGPAVGAAPDHGGQMVIPGLQAVGDARLEVAAANMRMFAEEVRARAVVEAQTRAELQGKAGPGIATVGEPIRDEAADQDGRFGWLLPVNGHHQAILMPGASLTRLRGLSASAPCIMVNGAPWWWNDAAGQAIPLPQRHQP